MKRTDLYFALAITAVFLPFCISDVLYNAYIDFNAAHGMIMSFIKFGLLSTMGEMLGGRIADNDDLIDLELSAFGDFEFDRNFFILIIDIAHRFDHGVGKSQIIIDFGNAANHFLLIAAGERLARNQLNKFLQLLGINFFIA